MTSDFDIENERREHFSSANTNCGQVMGAFRITEQDRMKVSHNQPFMPTEAVPETVLVYMKLCERCDVTFQFIVLKSCTV